MLYLFGAFLVYTGVKMARPRRKEVEVDPARNLVVRPSAAFFPCPDRQEDGRFFTRESGRLAATPLFIVLLVVETTDLVFALDSLPAVLAITKDGFVALTSNIFAILGLRSLYFALNGVMQLFRYLKLGLAVILVFIGVKMLVEPWVAISTAASLGVIGGVLTLSVLASALIPAKPAAAGVTGPPPAAATGPAGCRGSCTSARRRATPGRPPPPARQNRAEWFISRRCINSWWMM